MGSERIIKLVNPRNRVNSITEFLSACKWVARKRALATVRFRCVLDLRNFSVTGGYVSLRVDHTGKLDGSLLFLMMIRTFKLPAAKLTTGLAISAKKRES
jgi:hypothetical protein